MKFQLDHIISIDFVPALLPSAKKIQEVSPLCPTHFWACSSKLSSLLNHVDQFFRTSTLFHWFFFFWWISSWRQNIIMDFAPFRTHLLFPLAARFQKAPFLFQILFQRLFFVWNYILATRPFLSGTVSVLYAFSVGFVHFKLVLQLLHFHFEASAMKPSPLLQALLSRYENLLGLQICMKTYTPGNLSIFKHQWL